MNFRITTTVAAAVIAGSALAGSPALAATTVNVQLTDKETPQGMATGLTYGAPKVDLSKATDILKLSRASVPAGSVTFNVTNMSKEMVHEVLVVPVAGKPLPYLSGEHIVDESKIKSKGEVPELDPGKTGKLTVNLTPGTYLVLCNQPGHYEAGMWAILTVTK